nr:lamin tail domain-containing protein [Microbacterium cremeum]
MPNHRRALAAALAAIVGFVPLTVFAAAPASAAVTDLVINEVNSDPDDWFELANPTGADIDLTGMWFVDSGTGDPTHWVPLAGVVPADGVLAVDSPDGLGKGDSVSVYQGGKAEFDAGTATLVDTVTWPAGVHATSMGVCPAPYTGLVAMTPTKGAANDCPTPGLDEIRINEVFSAGADFVELVNIGSVPIDIAGWTAVDGDPAHVPLVLAETSTLIEPGGHYVFHPDDATEFPTGGFGLGKGDSMTIALPDGTEVDTTTWPADTHASPSWGRCPEGTGGFVMTTAATPGAVNDCPAVPGAAQIKINEVSSDPADWIELTNIGSTTVGISGWLLSDNARTTDPTHLQVIAAGTTIEPGAFVTIDYTAAGLGKGDEANLYLADATTRVDTTTWPADTHASSWGRCADGIGAFRTMTPTPGDANDCTVTPPPALDPHWDDVEINEISSLNDGDPGNPGLRDAVELVNTGSHDVSIQGWYQTDSGAASGASPLTLADLRVWNGDSLEPAGSWIVPAGGYVVFSSKKGLSGEGDAVKLYGPGADAASRQLVDEQAYGDGEAGVSDTFASNALSSAACPDGSDAFWSVTESSFGRDNTASCDTRFRPLDTTIVLNEVSNVAGKAELLNTGQEPVDISGWELLDAGDALVHTVPAGTVLAPGAFYVAHDLTGLESVDALTIRRAGDGASMVGHTWYEDGHASYSRCVLFGTVSYVETPTATWGAANACPGLVTETWPGAAEITVVDAVDAFTDLDANDEGDVSGAAFDPSDPGILWVAMNKGRLFKMHKVGGVYEAFPGVGGRHPAALRRRRRRTRLRGRHDRTRRRRVHHLRARQRARQGHVVQQDRPIRRERGDHGDDRARGHPRVGCERVRDDGHQPRSRGHHLRARRVPGRVRLPGRRRRLRCGRPPDSRPLRDGGRGDGSPALLLARARRRTRRGEGRALGSPVVDGRGVRRRSRGAVGAVRRRLRRRLQPPDRRRRRLRGRALVLPSRGDAEPQQRGHGDRSRLDLRRRLPGGRVDRRRRHRRPLVAGGDAAVPRDRRAGRSRRADADAEPHAHAAFDRRAGAGLGRPAHRRHPRRH